ncbi:flagellar basal body-associated FliL family protein [Clostridium sp.]|uniref:flagellar basal body-associated FliL family protein n=1 Tax=Clostridium sp. TaxID=1506 RepID=UPI00321727A7
MSKKNKENQSDKEKNGSSKVVVAVVTTILIFALISGAVFVGYRVATKNSDKNTVESSSEEVTEEFTLELEEFLVNLSDEGKSRYLKINIFLGVNLSNEELQVELSSKVPQIRDCINKILRTKKSSEFTPDGEEVLKQEIIAGVNEVLNNGEVLNIYFSSIIVQ